MSHASEKPPDLSIDEALRLYLAMSYPNGLPEGVDPEQFLEEMRQKVAAGRPEWAAADAAREPSPSTAAEPSTTETPYSQLKAQIAEQARREQVPEDPEERYLYERAKEARRNREERQAEEREEQAREELRQRLLAKKKDADEATVERAMRLRRVLEERVQRILEARTRKTEPGPLTTGAPERPALSGPAFEPAGGLDLAGTEEVAPPTFSASPASEPPARPMDLTGESFEDLSRLEPEEKIEVLRQFNQERRNRLPLRREVLSPRRPKRPRRREALSLETGKPERSRGLELEESASDEDLGVAMTEESKRRGLSLT